MKYILFLDKNKRKMYSKKSNNDEFSSNNKNKKIEQIKLKYEFKYKNKFNNNQDNLKDKITSNKNLDLNKSKNKIDEDDYNLEVFKNSISKNNFILLEQEDNYKYRTISVNDSFENKIKRIFNLNKNKNYLKINNVTPIELSSELNLSFEKKNDKSLILGKSINENSLHLINIIRIFDKCHKKIKEINQKSYQNKFNHHYIYKNRINNYNYLKFKNISKFSKKEKQKNLTKNINIQNDSHIKSPSGPIKDLKNLNDKISENRENMNYTLELGKKSIISIKDYNKENSKINGIISNNINHIIEQKNKINTKDEFIHNSIKIPNFPIGLNKKNLFENTNDNSIDNNSNNRNSVNFSKRFFYKYKGINNINRKAKSILEETEKNNNNQSINDSNKTKDNIKEDKIIKNVIEEKNRIAYKKIQRNIIYKNIKKNYISPLSLNQQNQNNNTENNLNKTMLISNKLFEQKSINNDDKNKQNHIIINKRKQNLYLNKNSNEFSNNYLNKNKNEENGIKINLGKSFIQSHQNTSQSLLSERHHFKNNDIMNSVKNLSKVDDDKNTIPTNIIKINDKNLINSRSFIFKSDKVNKSKIIFKNYNYKVINTQLVNIKPKNLLQNGVEKNEITRTDRFKRRIKLIKGNDNEKSININNLNQSQNILNLTCKNNNYNGNPFRESNDNYLCSKKSSNRLENHKFHEIKSTSCEKDNKKIQNHKDKNHISYKIDNGVQDKLITCTSMRNINLSKKIHIINKDSYNKKEQEKNS